MFQARATPLQLEEATQNIATGSATEPWSTRHKVHYQQQPSCCAPLSDVDRRMSSNQLEADAARMFSEVTYAGHQHLPNRCTGLPESAASQPMCPPAYCSDRVFRSMPGQYPEFHPCHASLQHTPLHAGPPRMPGTGSDINHPAGDHRAVKRHLKQRRRLLQRQGRQLLQQLHAIAAEVQGLYKQEAQASAFVDQLCYNSNKRHTESIAILQESSDQHQHELLVPAAEPRQCWKSASAPEGHSHLHRLHQPPQLHVGSHVHCPGLQGLP